MKFITPHNNTNQCSGCRTCSFVCAVVCPTTAIRETQGDGVFLKKTLCIQCGKCTSVCPMNAIRQNNEGDIFFVDYEGIVMGS